MTCVLASEVGRVRLLPGGHYDATSMDRYRRNITESNDSRKIPDETMYGIVRAFEPSERKRESSLLVNPHGDQASSTSINCKDKQGFLRASHKYRDLALHSHQQDRTRDITHSFV
jgi:hypothetical protein